MSYDPCALASIARGLAECAGKAVLDVYHDAVAPIARLKADGSPLTRADMASHRIICQGLQAATPDVPLVSEEGVASSARRRADWKRYWLVDPLDGTKEFLARNGEFTVNIALIDVEGRHGTAVLGTVHVPQSGVTYVGVRGHGAWRHDGDRELAITSSPPAGAVRVVASRSHGNAATDAFIEGLVDLYGTVERASSGSSLKLCRVAEGHAHFYPRVGPTMAWDTAAAQAIVEAAGAVVWRFGTRDPLTYDPRRLRNPPFLVAFGAEAALPDTYRVAEEAEA